ncbi:host attachment protein [Rhodovulum marinum]|uniref:Protein required for attachment to host cells n=1 Tax=Rhodovulum marinum TaxID=320662 RepID=A0A4R2PX74_9RHOB|nr:host attachment protein [Rhodovulum marinum]TCP40792.1 protein required for attachment to host cells [Rhodovulum marinum]
MQHDRVWIVAITATRARILRDPGGGSAGLAGTADLVMRADHRNLRDAMDRPADHARLRRLCGMAETVLTDPVQADQRDFFRQVVQVLETHRLAGDFTGLAIYAEAGLLQRFRAEMPARLAALVIAEQPPFDGDLGLGALEWLAQTAAEQ